MFDVGFFFEMGVMEIMMDKILPYFFAICFGGSHRSRRPTPNGF